MKIIFFRTTVVCLFFFIQFSCGGSGNRTGEYINDNDVLFVPDELDLLKNENLQLKGKENHFREITELKGEQIIVDSVIFEQMEMEIIIKDNFLIMKTFSKYKYFFLFSLPDIRLIRKFGDIGRGPEEFQIPHLCHNTQLDIVATIVESTNDRIYDVLPDGRLKVSNIRKRGTGNGWGSGEFWAVMTDSLLYAAKLSSTVLSVFTVGGSDGKQVNEIQKLDLDLKHKGANYTGDFAINPDSPRMVYAYKYFKVMKFFDTKHHTVRTIDFGGKKFDENSKYRIESLDSNISHYMDIFAGKKYVYVSYSGRTPIQVHIDNQKDNFYMFVEKYDWNGNLIIKYKLDQWGYFTVDEKNNMLYLISTNHDDPFFRYKL